jgi:acetyl esterase/lipase
MLINPPGSLDNEFGFIQKSLPVPEFVTSDLEGLNLNITIPLIEGRIADSAHQLPVFVYVHGGGFALGSNAWPHYDQSRIVKLSVELGLPVIGVGIKSVFLLKIPCGINVYPVIE